jgi:hypothetical protein
MGSFISKVEISVAKAVIILSLRYEKSHCNLLESMPSQALKMPDFVVVTQSHP